MTAIRTTDIWNLVLSIPSPTPFSRKKEGAVVVQVIDGDDEFVMETEDVRPMQAELQRVIKSVVHAFQEATLDRCIEASVGTEVVCSF